MSTTSTPVKIAAFVIVIWGVVVAKTFLIPLCLATLLTFLVLPLVEFLTAKRMPEWAAVSIGSLALCLPLIVIALFAAAETKVLIHNYPQLIASFKDHWNTLVASSFIQGSGFADSLDLSAITDKLNDAASDSVPMVLEVLKRVTEAGVHFILILFFAVVMLASRKGLRAGIERVASSQSTVNEISLLIEKFLLARMGIAVFVAVLDLLILKVFGTPYFFLLAILFGVATAIPILGFVAAIVPTIVISLSSGHDPKWVALQVGLLYAVASVESHFISPKYLGKQLNLNLLATFIGLYAGELLWGIWGMVLVIPLLGIARIILAASPPTEAWAKLLAESGESH